MNLQDYLTILKARFDVMLIRLLDEGTPSYMYFCFMGCILTHLSICVFCAIIINNAFHYRVEGQRNFCVLYSKQEILMKPRQIPHALTCFLTCFLRTLPTIHLAGAAKGGTSSICAYLIQHPYIHGSIISKESQYFQGRSFLGYYPFDWFNENLPLPFFLSFWAPSRSSPVLKKKATTSTSRSTSTSTPTSNRNKEVEAEVDTENEGIVSTTLGARNRPIADEDSHPWDKIVYRTFFPTIFHRFYCAWIRGDPYYHVIDAQPTLRLPAIAYRLAATNKEGKCIIILRDPIERAYSHYKMVKRNVPEMEVRSFEEAIIEEMDLHDEEVRTGQLSLGSQIHRVCNKAQSYRPLYILSDKMDAIKLDQQQKQNFTSNESNNFVFSSSSTLGAFFSAKREVTHDCGQRSHNGNAEEDESRLEIDLLKYKKMNLSGGSLALWFLDKRYADASLYANHLPHFTEAFGTDFNGKSNTLILSF